jgi:hypothetical protein
MFFHGVGEIRGVSCHSSGQVTLRFKLLFTINPPQQPGGPPLFDSQDFIFQREASRESLAIALAAIAANRKVVISSLNLRQQPPELSTIGIDVS